MTVGTPSQVSSLCHPPHNQLAGRNTSPTKIFKTNPFHLPFNTGMINSRLTLFWEDPDNYSVFRNVKICSTDHVCAEQSAFWTLAKIMLKHVQTSCSTWTKTFNLHVCYGWIKLIPTFLVTSGDFHAAQASFSLMTQEHCTSRCSVHAVRRDRRLCPRWCFTLFGLAKMATLAVLSKNVCLRCHAWYVILSKYSNINICIYIYIYIYYIYIDYYKNYMRYGKQNVIHKIHPSGPCQRNPGILGNGLVGDFSSWSWSMWISSTRWGHGIEMYLHMEGASKLSDTLWYIRHL